MKPLIAVNKHRLDVFGVFNKLQDGGQSYTPSQDFYPAGLWEKIKKAVMGSWF